MDLTGQMKSFQGELEYVANEAQGKSILAKFKVFCQLLL